MKVKVNQSFPSGDVEVLMKPGRDGSLSLSLIDDGVRYLLMIALHMPPYEDVQSIHALDRAALRQSGHGALGRISRERAARFNRSESGPFLLLKRLNDQLRWLLGMQPAAVSLDEVDRLALVGACQVLAHRLWDHAAPHTQASPHALTSFTADLIAKRTQDIVTPAEYTQMAGLLKTTGIPKIVAQLMEAEMQWVVAEHRAHPMEAESPPPIARPGTRL